MVGSSNSMPGATPARRDRLLRERVHDTYKSKHKLPEPTRCPECGAVYAKGKWTWSTAAEDAHEALCPACQRIRDKVPQAFVTLHGDFLAGHADEIMGLVENTERDERAEHPLKRIMTVEKGPGGIEITLTDAHLARRIGEAVAHAYQGDLDYQYTQEDDMLRVRWER